MSKRIGSEKISATNYLFTMDVGYNFWVLEEIAIVAL